MSGWARAFWVATILIVPGGFLLFLGYAFGRAVLRSQRAPAAAEASARRMRPRVTLKDVLREVRGSI